MKFRNTILISFLLLTNLFANPLAQGEMWIRVSNEHPYYLRGNIKIEVYDANWQLFDSAVTAYYSVEQDGNAFIWMAGEPVSTSDSTFAIGPLNYNTTYYIVIENKYARIDVGPNNSTPDEHLTFQNNTFSLNATHNTFTFASQAAWNPKTVTVKNSFNSGDVKIDGVLYQNIGSSGITKSFGEPTFPHKLEAIDNQVVGEVMNIYQSWTSDAGYFSSKILADIQAISTTYTANFLNQYNLTFKNSFVGVGNGDNRSKSTTL